MVAGRLTLRDRFFLWRRYYCGIHLVPKSFGKGGSYCKECDEETRLVVKDRVASLRGEITPTQTLREEYEFMRARLNSALEALARAESFGGKAVEKQFAKAEALLSEVQRGLSGASPLKRQIRDYFGDESRGELIRKMRSR